ncbi:MAG TPA: TRZ/ATZ family hydrolase [Wenzhouxiangella sp.]|nr:TRZ/ATZ family hydrolase [Wenzhouxiangella sp.]
MADQVTALLPDWIVPVRPGGEVLEQHALVMRDETISAIIPREKLADAFPDAARVELPGRVLLPGLINAHAHSAMTLLRGLADDLPLMVWLEDHIWPAEQQCVGPDYVRVGTELALAEMLLGGTTCFNDNYFFPDVAARTAIRAGMRATVGIPVISVPTAWATSEDEYFSRGLTVHQDLLDEPLVRTAFAPHAPYTVSDSAFRRIRELAEELDIPVHLHLLEAAGEIDSSQQQYRCHPIDRLDQLGLFNDRLLAVHMTQLTASDMDRVARAGVHVLHCPASNLKLASGMCPVAELVGRGVNVCIGTDGAASNNTLDMFAETRLAALLAKGYSGNPEAVPAHAALEMATFNAARALGLEDEIGSLEAGKQADLIAVDLDRMETLPVHHVISQLVYATGRHQVTDVWVAGQRLVRDSALQTLDESRIRQEAAVWQRRLARIDEHSQG